MAAARETYKRLHEACDHFLSGVSLDLLGFIPKDRMVREAIMTQKPLVEYAPTSLAAKSIMAAASTIENWEVAANLDGNIKFFWKNLLFRPR
jgi:flagellar biosynthesis protein FlhG